MIEDDFEDKFAQMVELAQTDPVAFEELRKDILEKEIVRMCDGDAEQEERLKRMQWRLEQDLSKYKDPIARYNAMIVIFYKQVEEFQKAISMQTTMVEAKHNADILAFPKKK